MSSEHHLDDRRRADCRSRTPQHNLREGIGFMNARRLMSRFAVVCALVVAVAALGVCSAPALAAPDYGFTSSFGSEGTEEGKFKEPSYVAVSEVGALKGDVYVTDKGNNRVEYFSSTGIYVGQFNGSEIDGVAAAKAAPLALSEPEGIAVDNDLASPSEGDVYVVDKSQGVIDKFSSTGEYLSQLSGFASEVIGVAVDPSGDVWVAEANKGLQEFSDAAINVLLASHESPFGSSPGIAVDSAGNLYVVRGSGQVAKLNKEGEEIYGFVTSNGGTEGLAIDSATNALFVDQGNLVSEFGPFGEPYEASLETFGAGAHMASAKGLAVSSATGTVYVADAAKDDVDILTLGAGELPVLESESVSAVTPFAASIDAQVEPSGQATSVEVEYSTEESGGVLTGTIVKVAGPTLAALKGSQTVSVELGEVLAPSTIYYYRVVAENAASKHQGKPADGPVQSFGTLIAPLVSTSEATEVTSDSATLSGTVDPLGGGETEYHYVYVDQSEYEDALRFDGAFREIDPAFEPYLGGTSTPEVKVPSGENTVLAAQSATITGLTPGASYHYALVATNTQEENGRPVITTVIGTGKSFKLSGTPPTLGAVEASNVTQTGVKITGSVNPQGLATRYELRLGTQQGSLSFQTAGSTSASGSEPLELEVGALVPGTTYYYELLAVNPASPLNARGQQEAAVTQEGSFTTLPGAPVASLLIQATSVPLLALPPIKFPAEEATTTVTTRTLSKAQKLKNALAACKKRDGLRRDERAGCEKQARKRYGVATKKKKG
jgi:streptogramin lyase